MHDEENACNPLVVSLNQWQGK